MSWFLAVAIFAAGVGVSTAYFSFSTHLINREPRQIEPLDDSYRQISTQIRGRIP